MVIFFSKFTFSNKVWFCPNTFTLYLFDQPLSIFVVFFCRQIADSKKSCCFWILGSIFSDPEFSILIPKSRCELSSVVSWTFHLKLFAPKCHKMIIKGSIAIEYIVFIIYSIDIFNIILNNWQLFNILGSKIEPGLKFSLELSSKNLNVSHVTFSKTKIKCWRVFDNGVFMFLV